MLQIADGRLRSGGLTEENSSPPRGDGMCPKVIQIVLAIYLTPVIVAVLLIGGTSVVLGKLSRASLLGGHAKPLRAYAVRPLVNSLSRRDDGQDRLASGRSRTRVSR